MNESTGLTPGPGPAIVPATGALGTLSQRAGTSKGTTMANQDGYDHLREDADSDPRFDGRHTETTLPSVDMDAERAAFQTRIRLINGHIFVAGIDGRCTVKVQEPGMHMTVPCSYDRGHHVA